MQIRERLGCISIPSHALIHKTKKKIAIFPKNVPDVDNQGGRGLSASSAKAKHSLHELHISLLQKLGGKFTASVIGNCRRWWAGSTWVVSAMPGRMDWMLSVPQTQGSCVIPGRQLCFPYPACTLWELWSLLFKIQERNQQLDSKAIKVLQNLVSPTKSGITYETHRTGGHFRGNFSVHQLAKSNWK